ncbi:hypothetical protein C8R45DRAFT_543569 [Mycena sanguinolenta]|nr:hypothetical protein C8R45DRAFT_543569 [Mycena sanguinolenta]
MLHRRVAIAAFHDSAESFPQPKCHPETRTQMLEDLRAWALDTDPATTILWLYGPAGAGKSAIMQALARQLEDAGRLGGCFFFKRGHATCGSGQDVFSTIAYQLALNCPALRGTISYIVDKNPSITELSIATQMKALISYPWRAHRDRDSVTVLIDGLDECDRHDAQEEILRAIRDSSSKHTIPLRFIVASRPEPHIREMFDSAFYFGHHRSLNVEQSFEDVRKYLRDEFSRIHRDHCTMAGMLSPWPSCETLEDLVDKSSGHFIYAATIIKFIDDKNYRPTQRLEIVLDGGRGSESAFDALDQLYMSILASAPRQAELVPITERRDCYYVACIPCSKYRQTTTIRFIRTMHHFWIFSIIHVGRTIFMLVAWTIGWIWLGLSSDFVHAEIDETGPVFMAHVTRISS